MDADRILIWKMKHGDTDAVEEFVRKNYSKILQYVRLRVMDHYLAEDLTQETFTRFFLYLDEYRHYGKVMNV